MQTVYETEQSTLQELDEIIIRAMDRVNIQKDVDLCHYLPKNNKRLHHFAFGKMKKEQPAQLMHMINENILDRDAPQLLPVNIRPSIKKKNPVELKLNKSQMNRLVNILKEAGEQELIAVIAPQESLKEVQKLMLDMIRKKEINQELWTTYIKLIQIENSIQEADHLV